jgi:phenylalanine-4-hydroxylase
MKYIARLPDESGIIHYSSAEHEVWGLLYDRQIKIIKNIACDAYLHGLSLLHLPKNRIPQPYEVSQTLYEYTGWKVEPVAALIDFQTFFELLANKKFPAASFIRYKEELDYLKEPDIFHELFGHCPLLIDKNYAAFMQNIGRLGAILDHQYQIMLGRLFWFTIEFGLIKESNSLKIYGAGILSSKNESIYALESTIPIRKTFNLLEVLRVSYRYDELQKIYFIINDLEELYDIVNNRLVEDFVAAKQLGMLPNLYQKHNNDNRSC